METKTISTTPKRELSLIDKFTNTMGVYEQKNSLNSLKIQALLQQNLNKL